MVDFMADKIIRNLSAINMVYFMAVVAKSYTRARYWGLFMANWSQQMTGRYEKKTRVVIAGTYNENTPSSLDDRVS